MAMKEYKKTIIIEPKIDESKAKQIERSVENMTVKKFLSDDAQKQVEEFAKKNAEIEEKIDLTRQALRDIENFKGPEFDKLRNELNEYLKSLGYSEKEERPGGLKAGWKDFFSSIGKYAQQQGQKLFNSALKFLGDIYDEAKQMMDDIASYSEKSMTFSSEATNLKLSYGLSGAEAYAWSQAAKDVGFSSFDDYLENFMYATDETNERLQTLVKKYEETYEQDVEVAQAYQQFQAEFEDFKKQLQMELIDFFMENKDTIKAALELGMTFMEAMLQLVGWIAQALSEGHDRTEYERTSAISDIYNNYGAQATNNTNVKIDNTFNGVSNNDRGMLIDAGSATYRQILEALK